MNTPLWTLEEAINLCRIIEGEVSNHGIHVALTGGVLYKGQSDHDVDLMFYPHCTCDGFEQATLEECLRKLGMFSRPETKIELFEYLGDRKFLGSWEHNGRRVDVFCVAVKWIAL